MSSQTYSISDLARELDITTRAIRFYERHGFGISTDKKLEDDTTEYLVRLEK